MIVTMIDLNYDTTRKVKLAKLKAYYQKEENYDGEMLDALGELERQEEVERVVYGVDGDYILKIKLTPKNWRWQNSVQQWQKEKKHG
jgi:hypothetical protein